MKRAKSAGPAKPVKLGKPTGSRSPARSTKPVSVSLPTSSARDRLLASANELFYAEGIHTVGIDRVIEHAGVAKASLYSAFGSKDELVCAYLHRRAAVRQQRLTDRIARHEAPRDRVLAVFDHLIDVASDPAFRGCAFVNATAEGPRGESKVRQVCEESRAWLRDLFTELARACGVDDATRLGQQLVLLYDGATVAASMELGGAPAKEARKMAELLLDAQAPASARKTRASSSVKSARRPA